MSRCRWDREREDYVTDGEFCKVCDGVAGRVRAGFSVDDAGCWVWRSVLSTEGYGVLSIHKRQFKAHRVSYELHRGPIPDGLQIDHLCRNRACVNPEHLEAVTGRVNVLRSPIAPTAINSRRTECVNGHGFTPDNTRYDRGKRYCLECKRRRTRISARKRRARERGDAA